MIEYQMKIMGKPEHLMKTAQKQISFHWGMLQADLMELGQELHLFITNYIDANRHRRSDNVGTPLHKAIDFYMDPNTKARIHWGIGNIEKLNHTNPYWYFLNFGHGGKTSMDKPFYGKGITGRFDPSGRPAQKGGNEPWVDLHNGPYLIFPGPIRPVPYIDVGIEELRQKLANILNKYRRN